MAKVLKFKDVKSDVDSRIKEFDKIRVKLNVAKAKKAQGNIVKTTDGKKEAKGLFNSISSFFSEGSKPVRNNGK
ncbi:MULTISPECIES: hypothetical protein [unclassified Flavobacterium]|jgi:hypothetical protein|uniref:hypothetical protein n=1 Tax=unclassified Flavobacterium TaxID=196869 RepID=UPI00057DAF81|nr:MULTISPECIES: hypothetical protein [unclassified Flavobacterium]KIA98207.1 hypothetical protein OA93_10475 [Flavobacterium sp. KMS]MEA9415144.1 hypothetical protein [Flavobacterium sp. PL02]